MATRQEIRSEETKRAILAAAGELFAKNGFEHVSIREIAKAAGCSHTTLYLYFKDKEDLLHQLSKEPLQGLRQQMKDCLKDASMTEEDRLKWVSKAFIRFCLTNRNMYTLFFMVKASRVDQKDSAAELQHLRTELFELMKQALIDCLDPNMPEEWALSFSRTYFYTLHGIVGTYTHSEESVEMLMERLTPTFDLAVEVLLSGCTHHLNQGGKNG